MDDTDGSKSACSSPGQDGMRPMAEQTDAAVLPAVLALERVLGLNDASPLVLIVENVQQSGECLLAQIKARSRRRMLGIMFGEPPVSGELYDASVQCGEPDGAQGFGEAMRAMAALVDANKHATAVVVEGLAHMSSAYSPMQVLVSLAGLGRTLIVRHNCLAARPRGLVDVDRLLQYMATTVLYPTSYYQDQARGKARDHALPDPVELDVAQDGVVVAKGAHATKVVVRVDRRRKSGRTVCSTCILDSLDGTIIPYSSTDEKNEGPPVCLDTSFAVEHRLDQKVRRDRVELPHYALQSREHTGDIIYHPDKDDDFDEDEDVDEDLLF